MDNAGIQKETNRLKREWNKINSENNEIFFIMSMFISAVVGSFTLILSHNNWLFSIVSFSITLTFMVVGMQRVHKKLESEFVTEELVKFNEK